MGAGRRRQAPGRHQSRRGRGGDGRRHLPPTWDAAAAPAPPGYLQGSNPPSRRRAGQGVLTAGGQVCSSAAPHSRPSLSRGGTTRAQAALLARRVLREPQARLQKSLFINGRRPRRKAAGPGFPPGRTSSGAGQSPGAEPRRGSWGHPGRGACAAVSGFRVRAGRGSGVRGWQDPVRPTGRSWGRGERVRTPAPSCASPSQGAAGGRLQPPLQPPPQLRGARAQVSRGALPPLRPAALCGVGSPPRQWAPQSQAPTPPPSPETRGPQGRAAFQSPELPGRGHPRERKPVLRGRWAGAAGPRGGAAQGQPRAPRGAAAGTPGRPHPRAARRRTRGAWRPGRHLVPALRALGLQGGAGRDLTRRGSARAAASPRTGGDTQWRGGGRDACGGALSCPDAGVGADDAGWRRRPEPGGAARGPPEACGGGRPEAAAPGPGEDRRPGGMEAGGRERAAAGPRARSPSPARG